ncbi:hypothetical protein F444_00702, partial [Phytophthora nicotianae P1976]
KPGGSTCRNMKPGGSWGGPARTSSEDALAGRSSPINGRVRSAPPEYSPPVSCRGPFALPRHDYVGDIDVDMVDMSGEHKEGPAEKKEDVP